MSLLRTYSDPMQLFVASHSPTVFNTLTPEEIRFVEMVDGETRVRAMTERELEASRKYLSEEGDMAGVIEVIGE